ncbi:MAG: hypothetical protein H0X08_06400 [Blastocatellia bacterium]|nr:hypothetical protein [Blastocatellia bacterium]
MKSIIFFAALAIAFVHSVTATDPQIWSVNTRADFAKGDARGVSLDYNGTLTLAPKLVEVYKTGQPYIWSSALDSAGNVYLATGGDGKVFKVSTAGVGVLFADFTEINVSAIAVGRSGEIFAATSPDGKVYKIDSTGKASVYFEPKEKYIWSLVVESDGTLAVGTGDAGKIYRVKTANVSPESSLLFDTSETHIISLATDARGNLFAGTDSNGLVMRFGTEGRPFGLVDSPLREVHDLAVAPDGTVYALVLGESVAVPKPDPAATPTPESRTVSLDRPNAANPEPAPKSRYDLTNAKAAVYRLASDGAIDLIWASTTITPFSIHMNGNDGVLLGTSDRGRIYSVTNDGREQLLLQTEAQQISTIAGDGRSLFATSSNQGSLYRIGPETLSEGSYESAVLDAKSTATWGRIWWRSSGAVTIQTRTGNTEKADETWSAWSTGITDQRGAQISSPRARYVQWRAALKSGATPPSLNEVNVSFAARNIAPEILSIQVLPTNVGLVPNPPQQIDPNIELSGLNTATFGIPNVNVPPRRVYQRGATSLQWIADDRNDDRLVFDVLYRQVGDASFKTLRSGLTDNFFVIDGQALADGRYIFQIVASDAPSNPASTALTGNRISEPVDIDNAAPIVVSASAPQISGDRIRVVFNATDSASYIVRAEYSVNGGEWKTIFPDDGISDSPAERYTIDVPITVPGEYAVTLRVFDVNRNSGNARIVARR